jgi:hypothetical protein
VATHLDSLTHFAFEEYFHGRTGEALGTQQMAYTATGFLILHHATTAQPTALFTDPLDRPTP